jgi:hypothetical protein
MRHLLILLMVLLLTACPGRYMDAATRRVAEGLTKALLNQTDIPTVRDGLPAYLLSIDGLINSSPDNADLLSAGSRLYSTYASSFVSDGPRARRLSAKGLEYGRHLLCIQVPDVCKALPEGLESFKAALAETKDDHVPALYTFASAWATWVQARTEDWDAIAELPKIQALMERVIELDDDYDDGNAHIYLGVLATQLPPSLGGKPEEGKAHFEEAIEISDGQNLIAKVLYAKQYARLTYNRPLHDRLLKEVLDAPAEVDGLTLSNMLAKEQAHRLKASADEYFE